MIPNRILCYQLISLILLCLSFCGIVDLDRTTKSKSDISPKSVIKKKNMLTLHNHPICIQMENKNNFKSKSSYLSG